MLNRELFDRTMYMMCEVYNREAKPALINGYWWVLQQMSDDEFKESVRTIMETRKEPSMPKPAEILEYSKPNIEAIATLALADLERAVKRGGYNMSLIFEDEVQHSIIEAMGGWVNVCKMSPRDWEFKRKEYTRLYDTYSKREIHPDHVAGLAEMQSGLSDRVSVPMAKVAAGYEVKTKKPVKALNPVNEKVAALIASKKHIRE